MKRTICQSCGKVYNFCDEEEMLEVFGEPEYVEDVDEYKKSE